MRNQKGTKVEKVNCRKLNIIIGNYKKIRMQLEKIMKMNLMELKETEGN